MNRLEIPEKKIDVQYPSSWDEIGRKNAGRIGEILYLCYTGKIDYDMARKLAVDEFLNRVNSPVKPKYGEDSMVYWGNESMLADSVNWLFTEVNASPNPFRGGEKKGSNERGEKVHTDLNPDCTPVFTINPKFCTQLIPYVKVGGIRYEGPKDLISDLTIYEWKEASWRLSKYAKTLDDRFLDELFVVLYCRGRGSRVLNPAVQVPIGVKFMTYLFFLGCMNWMREEIIEIDGEEIRFGCLFPTSADPSKGGAKNDDDHTGLAGIIFQMAESGVFGNMEQTSKVNMWDVFLRLYQIHHQIKKLKI